MIWCCATKFSDNILFPYFNMLDDSIFRTSYSYVVFGLIQNTIAVCSGHIVVFFADLFVSYF